ncbi:DEKNAAC100327 [Brettanomyces naardenensis]|uniref:Altered inheritance of mitochondria protein 11 n=1 Tax=Brettanomyces naardenensis TaxID=13370 RepID=A0A448YFG6_BRENA|nr:DEKNAAC100327 [Brettanomyces naardenensis]
MSSNSGFNFGKYLGRGDPSKKSEEVLKYNERRFYQASLFYGCSVLTYFASKIAYRGVVKRRFNPTFFQHNNLPPKSSTYSDALSALGHATLLATTSMATFVTGAFWYFDISNLHEFSYRMKDFLGGKDAERKLKNMPDDKETEELSRKLTDMIQKDENDAKK